jgi:hypothetical protein
MGQILSILWEIVLFCDILKICIVSKNFGMSEKILDPKMVHWPGF